jgi:hypothetical protein
LSRGWGEDLAREQGIKSATRHSVRGVPNPPQRYGVEFPDRTLRASRGPSILRGPHHDSPSFAPDRPRVNTDHHATVLRDLNLNVATSITKRPPLANQKPLGFTKRDHHTKKYLNIQICIWRTRGIYGKTIPLRKFKPIR